MKKNVNKASTKQEIYDAYNELLSELKEHQNPQQKKEKEDKEIIFTKASQQSKESFIKHISDLKIQLNKELEEIGETMLTEIKQLSDIREAIMNGKETLEELYKIKSESESLETLIQLQEIKKGEFEEEMSRLKELWEKEKEEGEKLLKETKTTRDKEQKREEEEYTYSLNLKRRKEQDEYEEKYQDIEKEMMDKKSAFEKEMKDREQTVAMKEDELGELRQKALQFPVELEKAIKTTEKSVTEKLTFEFETEKKLMFKELETDIKLKDQAIQTLESKVKELETTIKQISLKADSSEKTVKDIAIKAIESAGKVQVYEGNASPRNKKENES